MANGIVVSCSCFGEDEQPSLAKMTLSLLRDIVLAALALVILFEDRFQVNGRKRSRRRIPYRIPRETPATGDVL